MIDIRFRYGEKGWDVKCTHIWAHMQIRTQNKQKQSMPNEFHQEEYKDTCFTKL